MVKKTSPRKTSKPAGKSGAAKTKAAKTPAKAATAKGAAVKKKLPPKPQAKAAKATQPATKVQPPAPKPEAKAPAPKPDLAKHAETATTIKAPAKPELKPVLPQAAKKPDGKVVPAAKPGVKAPGEPGEPNQPREDADSPLLDMSDVGVRKMITRAKQRGYVTYDELNKVLPSDKVSSEQIEDTMSMLSEMGINVIESEEQDERRLKSRRLRKASRSPSRPAKKKNNTTVPTIPCACICARWARSNCCRAKAKSPSPNASRPAAS